MSDKPKLTAAKASDKYALIEKELGSVRIKLNESLKYHLASGSSIKAECFYIATTIKELTDALDLASELKIPYFLFGAGTKVLNTEKLEGLTIKNRTSGIKISGVKGKVSVKGIGVDEAMVEIESGVSLGRVNEFLKEQNLKEFIFPFIPGSTVGGSLYITPGLQDLTQKIKVWSGGEVFDIDTLDLKRGDIILSIIIKVKSAI